jgi:6-phosphogluconolactonase (cycloisomerase 2 family)
MAALVATAACTDRSAPVGPDDAPDLAFRSARTGAVYTSTNAAGPNEVLVFPRNPDGLLGSPTAYVTGGQGAGAGLGSQGAVVLSRNARWLLVANAGSNDVSVFRAGPHGLTLTDVEPSGGAFPLSVTIRGTVVYVLNAKGTSNVTGFRLSNQGDLEPITASTRTLSAAASDPAQVEFAPDGKTLIVTEKATNQITSFAVVHTGRLGAMTTTTSATPTPFGFAFDRRGHIIVSEAAGGAPGASVLSSYSVSASPSVSAITPSVATTQTAACWVLLARDFRLAFTTNTGSGTVSAFDVGDGGELTLRHAVAANTGAGSAPIDMALSRNGRFVFVLAPGGEGTVRPYAINADGTLQGLGPVNGIPPTAYGLAAF